MSLDAYFSRPRPVQNDNMKLHYKRFGLGWAIGNSKQFGPNIPMFKVISFSEIISANLQDEVRFGRLI